MTEADATAGAPRAPRPKRILLVDDHPVVRAGLAAQVANDPGLVVACATGDPAEALRLLAIEQPDVVIVDVSLGSASGLDLVRQIRARDTRVPILVWSMHAESLYAERALRAGAQGYLEKARPAALVLEAVHAVLRGRMYASPELVDRVLQRLRGGAARIEESGTESLTDRELRAFELMGAGLMTVEIAHQMGVSAKTVEAYRVRIKQKLGLASFHEVIQHATAWVLEHR